MRKFLLAAVMAATSLSAIPATAQDYRGDRQDQRRDDRADRRDDRRDERADRR